ncbi:MAG: acyl-CoA desaturase [Bacteroidota bacterium]
MKIIQFKKDINDQLFFKTLKKRVNEYFQKNNIKKTANKKAKIKAIILIAAYFLTYVGIFYSAQFHRLIMAYMSIGALTIFVALNIAHDAAHATFSSRKKINKLLVNVFDLLGASGYIWQLKHVHSHHPHVNIPNMDSDIKQSKLVRIFPNAPFHWFHRYQYLYMPVLYLLYTLVWLLYRDFRDFFKNDISGKPDHKHSTFQSIQFFTGKILFFSRMLIIPWAVLQFSFLQICAAFLLMHFTASFTVALALVSTHVGEHSTYPQPNAKGQMPDSWVRHQLITTSDFATENKWVTHLFGGFNHHVAHHLFPNICHIHYPSLTKILKSTCREFNMPYAANASLGAAILSHLKFLKIRSRQELKVPYLEM